MKRVLLRPEAVRNLEKLAARDRCLVEETIERFALTGTGDVKKLHGDLAEFRLRAGD